MIANIPTIDVPFLAVCSCLSHEPSLMSCGSALSKTTVEVKNTFDLYCSYEKVIGSTRERETQYLSEVCVTDWKVPLS